MSNHVTITCDKPIVLVTAEVSGTTRALRLTPESAVRAAQLIEGGYGVTLVGDQTNPSEVMRGRMPLTLAAPGEAPVVCDLPRAAAARLAASLRGCAYEICDASYIGVIDDLVTVVRYRNGQIATLWHEEYGWSDISRENARILAGQLEVAAAA